MDSDPTSVYEDFDVQTEWIREAIELDTLIVYIPGFTKEQLKVEVTTGGNLRIRGERKIDGNKFGRFSKEFPIPSNCDQDKIKAKFMGTTLRIKLVVKPSPRPPRPAAPPPAVSVEEHRLKYKRFVHGLGMGMKNPRKMVNMFLAVLFIVLLTNYATRLGLLRIKLVGY
ncbi:hypothetical protein V6N13_083925 [Hibiscus sabdariffa]|uniref:SHSP domain-containing protein n=1 Tax=Hibiscus sabdariffa TaxID=183260 RepID=A0ABR2SZI9_9ROSI